MTGLSVVNRASNSVSDNPWGCAESGCSRMRSTTLTTRTAGGSNSVPSRIANPPNESACGRPGDQPYGEALLILGGGGIITYGLYSFAVARYTKLSVGLVDSACWPNPLRRHSPARLTRHWRRRSGH